MHLRRVLLLTVLTVSVVGAGVTPALATTGANPGATATDLAARQQSAQCSFPFTATDATGTEVTVEERPERVTTLSPSAAQTMWAIGGKEQVVGVSQFAFYLDGAESRTNVSASTGVNVEKVVGTNPDLVLAPNVVSDETVAKLRDAGLTVFKFESATSVADVESKTTLTGKLTGNCAGAAEANAWMNANVEAAQSAVEGSDKPRAIYPLGGGYVAANGTFIDSMITASGAVDLPAQAGLSGYPKLSDEKVVDLKPEVLVITEGASAATLESEPYASTPAGKNDRTVRVDKNYLNQPAPRSVAYGVSNLTMGFHPDAYTESDFVTRAELNASGSAAATTGAATESPANATAATDGGDGDTGSDDAGAETPTTTETNGPGFGVTVAAVSLVAAALLLRRRR